MYELMRSVCDGISFCIFIGASVVILVHFLKTLFRVLCPEKPREGDHVLITGCDTGFGYEATIELSRRKTFVFAGCLTQEGVERLQNDPTFNGQAFKMDITKSADIENAKGIIENRVRGTGLWAVVNNAATGEFGDIEWHSVEKMQDMMNVNLWGSINVTKAMLPLIKEARGRIVNMSSMGGRISVFHGSAYSMTKYALEAFSDGLRHEMKAWGVSVHIIEPGSFRTNFHADSLNNLRKMWEVQPEEIKQSYGEEYYKSLSDILRAGDEMSSPYTYKVVNAICHAVTSSSPKTRYVVGIVANTLWMALIILPSTVGDFVVSLLGKTLIPAAMKS